MNLGGVPSAKVKRHMLSCRLATIALLVGASVLSGCKAIPARADVSGFLEPCPIAEPKRYTTAETIRVANARKAALIQCNRDKAAILSRLEQP